MPPQRAARWLRPLCLAALHLFALVSSAAAQSGTIPQPVVNAPAPQTSVVVSLSEFLTPGRSVTAALRAALDACRQRRAARLTIPPGRYVFDEDDFGVHLQIGNVSDLVIDGQGAEFVFTRPIPGLNFLDARRLVVRNLLIDHSLRIASPGVVRKTGGATTIRIADEYPVGPSTRVAAVTRFDVSARAWPESPVQAYFPDNVTMPTVQTFASPSFSQFADGDEVLVRHTNTYFVRVKAVGACGVSAAANSARARRAHRFCSNYLRDGGEGGIRPYAPGLMQFSW